MENFPFFPFSFLVFFVFIDTGLDGGEFSMDVLLWGVSEGVTFIEDTVLSFVVWNDFQSYLIVSQ